MRQIKKYGDIVNRQLKVNKKRNISTIVGIMLSIILFTTVGYIQSYYYESGMLSAKSRSGNYEAILMDISQEQVKQLKNNVLVKDMGIYKEIYSEGFNGKDSGRYLQLHAVDSVGLEELFTPIYNLKLGRLPKNSKEIMIDNVGQEILNKNIGNTMNINNTNYKIVGVYDKLNSKNPQNIEIVTYFDKEISLSNSNIAFNIISEKNKVEAINKIALQLDINPNNTYQRRLYLNELVFQYYRSEKLNHITNSQQSEILEYILYGAILILTIFFTYGSINTSIKERIHQFSILRCIGATPSKIRFLLIKESFLLGILSIIPGIILAQLICFFIWWGILGKIARIDINIMPFKIYPNVIYTSIFLGIVSILLSTILPIIKIGKTSPIEGTRNKLDIDYKVKNCNPKIIRKIFGYNGELAYKNIRGNNKSFFMATTISIITLTTFIVISGYSQVSLKPYTRTNEQNGDITVDINLSNERNSQDIFEQMAMYEREINNLKVTKEIYGRYKYIINGSFKDVKLNKSINKNDIDINLKSNNIIDLFVMDDKSLEEILPIVRDKNITLEDFKNNGVIVSDQKIVKNFINVEKLPLFDLEKNEKFKMQINDSKTIDMKYLGSIDIKKVFDISRYGSSYETKLIVSKDFFENNKDLFIYNDKEPISQNAEINLILELDENINRESALNILNNYTNKIGATYTDNELSNLEVKNSIIILASFIYLVLFLIIITGGVNLINHRMINIKLKGNEIGTLLAIGINKKRLKKIFILEGIIQWFISVTISIILSYSILAVLYKILIFTLDINSGEMPILATILGCTVLLIVNLIGSYLPIKKLRYINTTELIRKNE